MPTYGRVPLRGVVRAGDHPRPRGPDDALGDGRRAPAPGAGRPRPARPDVGGRARCPTTRARPTRPVRGLRVGVPRGYLWELLAPAIGERGRRRARRAAPPRALGRGRGAARVGGGGRRRSRPHPLGGRDRVPARPGGAPRRPDPRGAGAPRGRRADLGRRVPRRAARRRTVSRTPCAGSSPGWTSWPCPGARRRRPGWTRAAVCWSPCPRGTTPSPLNYPGVPALTVPCGFDGRGCRSASSSSGATGRRARSSPWPTPTSRRPTGTGAARRSARDRRRRARRRPRRAPRAGDAGPTSADRIAELSGSVLYLHTDQFFPGVVASSCSAATRPSSSISSRDERARLMDEVSDVGLGAQAGVRRAQGQLRAVREPRPPHPLAPDPAPRRRSGPARAPCSPSPHEPVPLGTGRARRPDRPDPESPRAGERRTPGERRRMRAWLAAGIAAARARRRAARRRRTPAVTEPAHALRPVRREPASSRRRRSRVAPRGGRGEPRAGSRASPPTACSSRGPGASRSPSRRGRSRASSGSWRTRRRRSAWRRMFAAPSRPWRASAGRTAACW